MLAKSCTIPQVTSLLKDVTRKGKASQGLFWGQIVKRSSFRFRNHKPTTSYTQFLFYTGLLNIRLFATPSARLPRGPPTHKRSGLPCSALRISRTTSSPCKTTSPTPSSALSYKSSPLLQNIYGSFDLHISLLTSISPCAPNQSSLPFPNINSGDHGHENRLPYNLEHRKKNLQKMKTTTTKKPRKLSYKQWLFCVVQ